MDELDERTEQTIRHLRALDGLGVAAELRRTIERLRALGDLDVDAEMRREAAHRLNVAAEGMPDKPRIAALSLAIWLTTTSTPEATEAARVLLGRADEIEGGAR